MVYLLIYSLLFIACKLNAFPLNVCFSSDREENSGQVYQLGEGNMYIIIFLKLFVASGVCLPPLPEVYTLRAAGFEPELVKLTALPRYQ
jgi:hypothetical protein